MRQNHDNFQKVVKYHMLGWPFSLSLRITRTQKFKTNLWHQTEQVEEIIKKIFFLFSELKQVLDFYTTIVNFTTYKYMWFYSLYPWQALDIPLQYIIIYQKVKFMRYISKFYLIKKNLFPFLSSLTKLKLKLWCWIVDRRHIKASEVCTV